MTYEEIARSELTEWKKQMQRKPGFTGRITRTMQVRVNKVIPEKVHQAITTAIKQMTRAVCFGAEFTAPKPLLNVTFQERELRAKGRIDFYRKTAAAEGAVTGAGGILLGLADFPIWLALKMKMLFEVAALYGLNVSNYKERVFLLYIFELTFSSQHNRNKVFSILQEWQSFEKQLPGNINDFNWRQFQQEYRDYIDIAKLLQLIPGVGAVVGAFVNHRLTGKLGNTAINAFRMRIFEQQKITGDPEKDPRPLSD